jgi:uncharacterized linocin/CFP29 family protein
VSKRKQVRRIHIDGAAWTYIVGRRFVSIRNPDGKRTVVPRTSLFDPYPTPQQVKNYVWRKLKPEKMIDVPSSTDHAKAMVLNLFTGANR